MTRGQPVDGRSALRDKLVRAAIGVVAEGGLSRLTYRSLAARVGVTHGSVQHHFNSIDAVLESALALCLDLNLKPAVAPSPMHYVDALVAQVRIDPEIHAFQYELILESKRQQSLRPLVRRLYAAYWQPVEASLRSMGLQPNRELVRTVFAVGEGVVFQLVALDGDDPDGPADAIAGLRTLLDLLVAQQVLRSQQTRHPRRSAEEPVERQA